MIWILYFVVLKWEVCKLWGTGVFTLMYFL
jgi:hypothetical protein